MKLMLKYLWKYKWWVFLDFLSAFGFALVELGIPTIISSMVDRGIERNDTNYLFVQWIMMVGISIAGVLGTVLLGYCCVKISTSITRDIRQDVFEKTQTFSAAEIEHFGVSSLITRTNNDAYQIMMFLNSILRMAMIAPIMIIVSLALVIRISLPLSWIVIATIPLILLGVIFVGKVSEPISSRQQALIDRINLILRENISGIRVIRAFCKEPFEQERFEHPNDQYRKESSRLFMLMSFTEPTFFFLMNIAMMTVYWVSCSLLQIHSITLGQLLAFVEYVFHVMMSVMIFCMVFMMYPRANVSAKRIQAIFDTDPSIKDKKDALTCKRIETLLFEHVSFAYSDGTQVLHDISFSCKAGQKVAVIGSTGAGKSTLVQLISRLYDVSQGQILINGHDIRDYSRHSLRRQMGYVAQKARLFQGTILSNVKFGKMDGSLEEVKANCDIAQASEFIFSKPKGFDDPVEEKGMNLSGGQRQRLSIARALMMDASLYLYDDSFSALDFKTDRALREALVPKVKNAIFFVVASRISSIMDADLILVLDHGHLVGKGNHEQLMKSCSIYQNIAYSQLSRKEWDEHVE